jgi:hypothetical protein
MASSTATDGGLDNKGCLPDIDSGTSNANPRRRIYRYPAPDVSQRPTVSTSKSSALLETSLTDVVETYDHDLVPTGSNGSDDFDRHEQHSRGSQSHSRSIQVSGSSGKLARITCWSELG